jgi:hypothetical protein
MSDKVLLSPSDMIFYLSDSYIMVGSRETGEICIFDRTGKIVSHFNRMGRGPGEYFDLGDVMFDDKAEEFFVFDNYQLTTKILVYSFDGKHKRTLPVRPKCDIEMWDFDAGSMLIYDKTALYLGAGYSTIPYFRISKTDGSVIETLPIELPERYSENVKIPIRTVKEGANTTNYWTFHGIVLLNNRLGGKDFTLADISSDTVYRYSRERLLTPAFVRTPSVHASEPRRVWSAQLVTEDFIVFSITSLDFGEDTVDPRSLMYDYATGRIGEVSFFDENYQSGRWPLPFLGETDRPINTDIAALSPLRLKEANEKGELSGPLAEIAATIKEDANPVVMIVKFK